MHKKTKDEERLPRILQFKIGDIIYKAGIDRSYYGIYLEEMKIESFILDHPKGKSKILWEFGNISHHKNQTQKIGDIKVYNPSDCVKSLKEAEEKIKEQIKLVIKDLEIKRANNIENIEGLKEILKLEIQESLEFSRASNKIINQYKKIDLDKQFIKKIASKKQET